MTTDDASAATDSSADVVSSATAVMRVGHRLSDDLRRELEVVIGRTARRERSRRRTTNAFLVMGVTAGLMAGGMGWTIALLVGCGLVGLTLLVSLWWGLRNRALLDAAAADAGVERDVLTRAVFLCSTDVGPSASLRESLRSSG